MCKYNDMGFIIVMKAMCPVHGYMVRRGYDYSLTNSEEDEDIDEEEERGAEGREGGRGANRGDVEAPTPGDDRVPNDVDDEQDE